MRYAGKNNSVVLPADISSQFISAFDDRTNTPRWPRNPINRRTCFGALFANDRRYDGCFGVEVQWENNRFLVPPQTYQARPYVVEADWSSALILFCHGSFGKEGKIVLKGLFYPASRAIAV